MVAVLPLPHTLKQKKPGEHILLELLAMLQWCLVVLSWMNVCALPRYYAWPSTFTENRIMPFWSLFFVWLLNEDDATARVHGAFPRWLAWQEI